MMKTLEQKMREAESFQDPSGDAPGGSGMLALRWVSDITSRLIDWLWWSWLPLGMLTLFAGYGGGGKSTVALQIAAAVTTGGKLPDGSIAPLGKVLYFAAEDSAEHTIRPRLEAMGADMSRVAIVDGILQPGKDPGWVQLQQHIGHIEHAVAEHGFTLVVIDPISSYIGDANSDRESDVRTALTPLAKMAERTGCAVLMIRHLSKGGGDGRRAASRILGSTAWTDVPRVVWILADAPEEHQPERGEDGLRAERRVLGVTKANLSAKPATQWFEQPVVGPMRWLPGPAPVTIDECFLPADHTTKTEGAVEWLRERLAGGAQETTKVEDAAKLAGFSKRTLVRARATLNVKARKEPSGTWVLSLPPKLTPMTRKDANAEPKDATPSTSNHLASFHNVGASKDANPEILAPFPESLEECQDRNAGTLVRDSLVVGKDANSAYIGTLASFDAPESPQEPPQNVTHLAERQREPLAPTGTDPEVQVF